MNLLSIMGVLFGVFTIIYLSWKGVSIAIGAPLATLIAIVFNRMDVMTFLLGNEPNHYMGALGNYIIHFFPIFLMGSVLAKLMEDSGATTSIANFILKKIGLNQPYRVMVAIFIIGFILTYGGISIFVVMFTIIPLARTLFKKLDISWKLIQIPLWLGVGTLTVTMFPGTPSIHNVIPIQFLSTSLTAAAIPSIVASIGCAAFGLLYMKYALKKSIRNGETFLTYASDVEVTETKENLPSFMASIIPLATLVLIVITGSTFGSEFIQVNVIYIALITAIFLALILLFKDIPNKINTLSHGASGAISAIFATASAVAFGSAMVATPGFSVVFELITAIPGNPLISLTVLTSIISAVTGSSSGTLGIVMPNFAGHYLEAGVHPELIHRVAAIGSNLMTHVPQSGVLITFLTLSKLNHKNGYTEGFIVIAGGSLIAVILVISLGTLLY